MGRPIKKSFVSFFESITSKVLNTDKTETSAGLHAYRRNYLWGHIEPLQKQFPVTSKALGEKNFMFFAREFLYDNPPESTSFDKFSNRFAIYVSNRPELANMPLLAPLTKLDLLSTNLSGTSIDLPSGSLAAYKVLAHGQAENDIPDLRAGTESIRVRYEQGKSILEKL